MTEYIKRSDAIEVLTGWDTEPTDMDIKWALNNLPAEDVTPVVHARWKSYHDYFTKKHIGWICTNCSGVQMNLINGDSEFCPRCGAWMDGE